MRTKWFLLWIVVGASAAAGGDWEFRIDPQRSWGPSDGLDIQVTPSSPTASTEVLVTVRGWTSMGGYQVYDTDVRIEGADIWLDLYWQAPEVGTCAFTPYLLTQSLGRLGPGTYTVHVTNKGANGGGGTATFTVSESADDPGPVLYDPGEDDPGPIDLLDPFGWLAGRTTPTINLPGFEINHVPISDIGGAKDGISELRIEPAHPKSSDEVSVTISGWKPNPDLDVERTTLRIEGNLIWLDLYWYIRPPMPIGHEASPDGICKGQMFAQSVTVVQLDVTPYSGVPFAYTQSLGTLSPGTYTLHVTNHSPMTGSASISFTVLPSAGASGQPSWWQSLLQGIR
jgi:hypothetical protein